MREPGSGFAGLPARCQVMFPCGATSEDMG
jgi:hypothetical protein